MSNVRTLRSRKFPNDVRACLKRLLAHVDDPGRELDGIAFVAFLDDSGFIADACGKARADPAQTRLMLHALDAKLAKWEKR